MCAVTQIYLLFVQNEIYPERGSSTEDERFWFLLPSKLMEIESDFKVVVWCDEPCVRNEEVAFSQHIRIL